MSKEQLLKISSESVEVLSAEVFQYPGGDWKVTHDNGSTESLSDAQFKVKYQILEVPESPAFEVPAEMVVPAFAAPEDVRAPEAPELQPGSPDEPGLVARLFGRGE